jgi:hypothetical protein
LLSQLLDASECNHQLGVGKDCSRLQTARGRSICDRANWVGAKSDWGKRSSGTAGSTGFSVARPETDCVTRGQNSESSCVCCIHHPILRVCKKQVSLELITVTNLDDERAVRMMFSAQPVPGG